MKMEENGEESTKQVSQALHLSEPENSKRESKFKEITSISGIIQKSKMVQGHTNKMHK